MIYVDNLQDFTFSTANYLKRVSGWWCHMWSDTSVDELHEFAARLGLKLRWFQNKPKFPHYDLTPNKRVEAIRLGAKVGSLQEYLRQRREKEGT